MNLAFERVLPEEDEKISVIYEIIKSNGEDMFHNQGLMHWRTPYPKKSIQKNCSEREVFLARDLDANQYVHTFQLEFTSLYANVTQSFEMAENGIASSVAIINKFATTPQVAGKGIGRQSIDYIEAYCRNKRISKICLDVYDKSERAIQFYTNRGFKIVGTKPTKYFTVYLMEKVL